MKLDILSIIPGKKKKTAGGWYSFNAVCCHNRGHKADRRSRGGIKFDAENNWTMHCFNCNFTCSIKAGRTFSRNLKQLLDWCGVDKTQIDKWSLECFGQRGITDFARAYDRPFIANFISTKLPEGSIELDPGNPEHAVHVEYLKNRGLSPYDYPYYITPLDKLARNRNRIIIPFFYDGLIIGNTSRFYDGESPKYLTHSQTGYVFNIDAQPDNWSTCILVEGQFDALSIGGCAYMSSSISDKQAALLGRLRRRIIVVPDRDRAGLEVCDRALELGYQVSIPPNFSDDIKDVNDAVKRYGKLATILSILEHASSSKIKIDMMKRKLKDNSGS